jgi:DNA-binding response OmpR family regulator
VEVTSIGSVRHQSIHILLIEDDGAIADMYRLQLEYDGYQVTIATTGENGFATMAAAHPDIVLLDLLLPDRSGFEIMADLGKEFPNHPPVVILSNYGEPTMIDKGLALGAIEYLVKSRVTPALISQKIPGWIEQAGRGQAEPDD